MNSTFRFLTREEFIRWIDIKLYRYTVAGTEPVRWLLKKLMLYLLQVKPVTYSELLDLITNKELEAGQN